MKSMLMKSGFVLLLAALPVGVQASQQSSGMKNEGCWTGTVTLVDTQDKNLTGEHWAFTKTFNLGEKCAISTIDNKAATLGDLRPGEKVRIRYQHADGVLVANSIVEMPLRYRGTVQSVDQKNGTITMQEASLYQPFVSPDTFHIAGGCKIILSNGKDGSLANLQPGDRVIVAYELPKDAHVAYLVRDRTASNEGIVSAIDLSRGTVQAKENSGEKQFVVGNDCKVILSSDKTGDLKDLMPGQECRFTYQDVNGINVLDRIAVEPSAKAGETASLQ